MLLGGAKDAGERPTGKAGVNTMQRCRASGIEEEYHLLDLPERIVGVGYPGNDPPPDRREAWEDGVNAVPDDHSSLTSSASSASSRGDYRPQLASSDREIIASYSSSRTQRLLHFLGFSDTNVRLEWGLRSALVSALTSYVVLMGPSHELISGSIWVPVLGLACCKPTLGHTLHGWWDAAVGGLFGWAVALIALYAISGAQGMDVITTEREIQCGVAVLCMSGVITFTFGDNIQARWALLPVAVVILSGLAKPQTARNEIHIELLKTIVGFNVGGLCATLCLLLPIPRFALPQLRQRLVAAYRIAVRMHAVLLVAALESENPRLLHQRSLILEEKLIQSEANVARLWEVSKVECALLWFFGGRETLSGIKSQIEMFMEISSNLHRRHERRLTALSMDCLYLYLVTPHIH